MKKHQNAPSKNLPFSFWISFETRPKSKYKTVKLNFCSWWTHRIGFQDNKDGEWEKYEKNEICFMLIGQKISCVSKTQTKWNEQRQEKGEDEKK